MNKITKITVNSNTWEASRARVMLLWGKGISQNLILYNGEKYNDSRKIELPTPKFGDLQIKKVDEGTGKILKGIEFKIYNQTKGQWLKIASNGTISFDNKFDNAITLTTNNEGYANAQGLSTDRSGNPIIKNLPAGSYIVYETNIPEDLSDYYEITTQYNVNGESITAKKITGNNINSNGVITVGGGQTILVTAKNKQDYINISGYVWEDVPGNYDNKTDKESNNIKDSNDYLINGIKVALKDQNGNIVTNGNGTPCETITSNVNGENGFYRFEKIQFDKLSNYYVEFEYDGITYQNIITDTNKDESSKAAETQDNRDKFNNAFSEITGIGQEITNLNEDKIELKYKKQEDKTVILSNSFKINKPTIEDNDNNAVKIATIEDNEDEYNNGYTSYPIYATTKNANLNLKSQYDKLIQSSNGPVCEIKNINLGLDEREKTDLYVGKDLYSVKLSINGFNHIYKYGYKPDEYYEKKNASFNVGVEFMKEKGISRYTRPIYKSDADYINNADKNKELKTYITYKISMVNDTTSLTTRVNSLVDYFDSKYNTEGIKVGTTYNDETGEVTNELTASIEEYNDKYNKMIIETNAEIEAKKSQDIYVRFELSREQVAEILKGEEGNAPIDNVVEVNSYTTLQDGKIYASIDKDSIPANADPSKTTGEGNNETYEDDTDIAPTLVLTPFDDRTMSGIVFEDNAISQGKGNVRQGNGVYDEGEKTVKGVTVVMTQVDKDGNEVKDENGNVVKYTAEPTNNEGNFTISNYIPGYYKITYTWGKDQGGYDVKDFKATIFNKDAHQGTAWYRNETTRYSDAMDDYELRKNIDKGEDITLMNSTTPLFGVGVDATGSTDEGIISISDGNQLIRQDTKAMDFGIIERARQIIDLNKSVDTVKITNAQGVVINDARVNENGELEGETKNLTGGPSYGYVKAEIEDEMIQGSTIEIGYKISVVNNSELDYDSEDFYHYGEIKGNVVKLRAEKLYDYLDSAIALDTRKEENKSWVVKPASDILSEKETLTESYFNEGISEDGNSGFWETASKELTQIFTQWQDQITESMTVRNIKIVDRTVLEKNLSKELAPGESIEEKISASTILSPSAEIRFENDAEIPEVTRTTDVGRNVDVTKSQLYDRGEWVGVTGPTGANKDYTMTIIISLSAVVILGAGVIFIKKKVL